MKGEALLKEFDKFRKCKIDSTTVYIFTCCKVYIDMELIENDEKVEGVDLNEVNNKFYEILIEKCFYYDYRDDCGYGILLDDDDLMDLIRASAWEYKDKYL